MDLDSIKTTLDTVYGINSGTIPDGTNLDAVINQAIKKISIYYPEIELTSLETVKNQTRYTVTDTNLIRVKRVYYGYTFIDDSFDGQIKQSCPEISSGSTYSISRKMTDVFERANLKKLYPYGADIISYNKFDLIPTPTSVETVYYEYERYRLISEVPDIFEEDVIELIFYYMEENEYKRSTLTNSGNIFQFDRRGNNTQLSSDDIATKNEERRIRLQMIEKSIKTKLLKL